MTLATCITGGTAEISVSGAGAGGTRDRRQGKRRGAQSWAALSRHVVDPAGIASSASRTPSITTTTQGGSRGDLGGQDAARGPASQDVAGRRPNRRDFAHGVDRGRDPP